MKDTEHIHDFCDWGNYLFLLCINGPFEMHGMFPVSKF